MTACSWQAGWRSLLLRAYDDPAEAEEFTTPATADHLLVLVTGGSCNIEGRYRGRWHRASYCKGSLGMTAPGQEATLRWRGTSRHQTLQLHLPGAAIRAAAQELSLGDINPVSIPSKLLSEDPLLASIMVALSDAMTDGAPDLYAETAANLLSVHLLVRHAKLMPRPLSQREDQRLKRVDELMRDSLGAPLSLEAMAQEVGLSRFHLLRLFKQVHGETPFKRLTRLRIEEAQRRLLHGHESVTDIAFACGYENSTHFAVAFRRLVGVTPTAYRERAR